MEFFLPEQWCYLVTYTLKKANICRCPENTHFPKKSSTLTLFFLSGRQQNKKHKKHQKTVLLFSPPKKRRLQKKGLIQPLETTLRPSPETCLSAQKELKTSMLRVFLVFLKVIFYFLPFLRAFGDYFYFFLGFLSKSKFLEGF